MTLEGMRTLVLDASFRPLQVIRWQRAMVLDLLDRVDVLEYYDLLIRTSCDRFPLPAVIRHRVYVRKTQRGVALSRRNLLIRDRCRCQYCGRSFPEPELTLDHVHPKSRGGASSWTNLVAACGPCNRKKADRTPTEADMPLLSAPAAPRGLGVGREGLLAGQTPDEWMDYLPR